MRPNSSLMLVLFLFLSITAGTVRAAEGPAPGEERASEHEVRGELTRAIGISKGICAVLGAARPEVAVELARDSELSVYVQSPDAQVVLATRRAAEAAGILGTRVFADKGSLRKIHLADNIADRVLVLGGANVPNSEILRILRPGGKALFGRMERRKPFPREELLKPLPEGTDPWSHPHHGPDNNPVSTDELARFPYLTQFIADPKFCPMAQVTVGAGGRVFKAYGNHATKANQNHLLNSLLCINGYNGTILWKRPLSKGHPIHRNTMIATPETLYLGDDESCKLIDAATGKLRDEIVIGRPDAEGSVWKWMALEDGVLYALVGDEDVGLSGRKSGRRGYGHWSWGNVPKVHKDPSKLFGLARTILAIDLRTNEILWNHREEEYVDARGMCMRNGRIYFYSPQKFLGCLDAKKGDVIWRNTDADLLEAIGPEGPAQNPGKGYSSAPYIKCNDKYVFFAGGQRKNLVAASTKDGKLVWKDPEGNVHLILRDEALYAIGNNRRYHRSLKLDYETGKVLGKFMYRSACTRATASVDSIFYRGGGTIRHDPASGASRRISPMRPPCQDGVVISGGMLYWGPWMCGCNLSLYGHIALGPRGDAVWKSKPDASRLEAAGGDPASVEPFEPRKGDWTHFRGSARGDSVIERPIPAGPLAQKWSVKLPSGSFPTAPVAVNDVVFVGDRSGIVRALSAADGKELWKAYTGGQIVIPPAVWNGRLYVGSADGWVYAFEAATGRRLWRFRAAPAERWIPVYGKLMSTWPVAGGVVVKDGTLYAAAGIASYDGTHVYALDAITGKLKWYNDSSGELSEKSQAGISLQGNLYVRDGKLCFAGGNAYKIAAYDLETGKCLTPARDRGKATVFEAYYPEIASPVLERGLPGGRLLLYNRDSRFSWVRGKRMVLLGPFPPDAKPMEKYRMMERKQGRKVLWSESYKSEFQSFIVGSDAVLAARGTLVRDRLVLSNPSLVAFDPEDGSELWTHPLPAEPVKWGTAVDHRGRVFVSTKDGRVVSLEPANQPAGG